MRLSIIIPVLDEGIGLPPLWTGSPICARSASAEPPPKPAQ
jgi:hypothetical protein